MSKIRVIAYPIFESEWAAAELIDATQKTESFIIGHVEEPDLASLRDQGILIDEFPNNSPNQDGRFEVGELGVPTWGVNDTPQDFYNEPSDDDSDGSIHTEWLMSIDGLLDSERRSAVLATGAVFIEHVPNFSYVMTASRKQANDLLNLDFVVQVRKFGQQLISPLVASSQEHFNPMDEFSDGDEVPLWDLWLTRQETREDVLTSLRQHRIQVVGSGGRKIRIRMEQDHALWTTVSRLSGVLSMMRYFPPKVLNNASNIIMGVKSSNPGHRVEYRGRGQIIAVADTGLDQDHLDFQGRIVDLVAYGRRGDTSDPDGHGTHVVGSALSDGSSSAGEFAGVAPEARLYFQSLLDSRGSLNGLPVVLQELFDAAYDAGARIHSNSWGASYPSSYTPQASEIDDYVAKRRDMLIIIAAGNEGDASQPRHTWPGHVDWYSITSPASAKNALAVGAAQSTRTEGGAQSGRTYGDFDSRRFPNPPTSDLPVSGNPESLAAFSSRGPTDDGRIKPDLVAPGTDILSTRSRNAGYGNYGRIHDENDEYVYMSGTSMACPMVAGCAALVREYYVRKRQTEPSAALLKATLINGTRWLTGADALADHTRKPNYHQGFGEVYLPSTIPLADVGDITLSFLDTWNNTNLQFFSPSGNFFFSLEVAAGHPLRVCLAYTDPPGRGLQNILSLVVIDPDGKKYTGNFGIANNQGRLIDYQNNVEVVDVPHPVDGTWKILVRGIQVLDPQDFALVATGNLLSDILRSVD